jgi:probable F420-dependent oxidoreductase
MAFTLTAAHLLRLCQINSFRLPGDGFVFFGLRGCLPALLDDHSFAARAMVAVEAVDYRHPRCLIGQWRVASDQIAVFPGSTVPHLKYVKKGIPKAGEGVNELMTGFYADYRKGTHLAGKATGHAAFRQTQANVIRRTGDDLDYDDDDRIEVGNPHDNIHAAWCQGVSQPDYSSAGCQVIVGYPKCAQRGDDPAVGPWKTFHATAYGVAQDSFPYALFNAREAEQVALKPDAKVPAKLRFGSKGDLVTTLQTALKERSFYEGKVDDDFGPRTIRALIAFQKATFGARRRRRRVRAGDRGGVGPRLAGGLTPDRMGSAAAPCYARGMRFGIQLGIGLGDIKQLHDIAQLVEELGYDVIYFPDHLVLEGPERQRMGGPSFDSMAMAIVAAQATKRVRIGHMVLCNLFRHPAITAQSLATLDHLSDGRALAGLGSGWTETEFRMTGIPFPPIGERLRLLDESLACIRGLWGDAPFTHDGEFFHFREADILPRTVQKPHPPIVLGGGGKGLLRVAARHADVLNLISEVGSKGYISMEESARLDHDAFRAKIDFVRAEAAKLGRDPQSIEISNFAFTMMLSKSADAVKAMRDGMASFLGTTPDAVGRAPMALIGSPEEVVAELRRRAQAWDVREVCFQLQDEATVKLFAAEVIPALR